MGGQLTYDDWSEQDFMIHGWKGDDITKQNYYFATFVKKNWTSPFLSMFDISKCGKGYSGWNWRKEKKKKVEEIKLQLKSGFWILNPDSESRFRIQIQNLDSEFILDSESESRIRIQNPDSESEFGF
uniref:Uncharacterized protein n=1 Tax=Acrobeloides nanus TaxID=290746 RepID=A0A914D6H2_9BILA